MNKLAITALIVGVLSFFSQYLLLLLSGIGEQAVLILFYLIPIVGLILGVVALRQIRRTGEKGKIIAWISIALTSIYLIGVVLLMLLGLAVSAQNTNVTLGDAARQALSGNEQVPLSTASQDMKRIAQIKQVPSLMDSYKRKYGQFPSETEFFTLTSLDRAQYGYASLSEGNGYVLRTVLEEDRDGFLESSMDSDGMVGGLDCSDEKRYFCMIYPRQ